ncbi:MAG: DEAD/DEAH box helicase, partial [Chloroflexota bacterium]
MVVSRTTRSSSKRSSSLLDAPVTTLRGVGPDSAPLLGRLGIETVEDLLWHLPRRYEDFSRIRPLRSVVADQKQTAIAVLGRIGQRRTARGLILTEAELADEDGRPTAIKAAWFGRSFVKQTHREGERVRLSGEVKWVGRGLQFTQPNIEPADREAVHTGRIVPMYRLTEGVKEGQLRRWLHTAVEGATDRSGKRVTSSYADLARETLPDDIRSRHDLPPIAQAIRQIHFPEDEARLLHARRRLAFEELLVLQLALAQRRARWTTDAKAAAVRASDSDVERWIRELPFALTGAQRRAFEEIRRDLGRTIPMSRLLEGEVGSGKTVVAALAARLVVSAGAQAAIMAPTELLAEQHFRTLGAIFGASGPRTALLTSSVTGEARQVVLEALASGSADVVVGTHALVEE